MTVNYMQIYLERQKKHKKVGHSFTTKIGLKLGFSTICSVENYYFMHIGPFCMHFIFKILFVLNETQRFI